MKLSISLVILGWVIVVVAFCTDYIGISQEFELFGRAGSLLTLTSAILEYLISTKGQRDSDYKDGGPVSLLQVGRAALLTQSEKRARLFAHISVVSGTIIWGFGDLIVQV